MGNKVRAASAVLGAAAVIGVGALTIPAIADAASPSPSASGSTGAGPRDRGRHAGAEKELSGTSAAKVKAAVLAKLPGATVDRMSAEDAAEKTGAAYEAHVTKADGTRVEVLLDKNDKVLSTKADERPGGPGGPGGRDGPGGPDAGGGPGGPHGRAEAVLTDTNADKVKAAVLAKLPGATVDRMSAEDAAEKTDAAYEAHVTKADGTRVEVLLDKAFTVLSTRP